MFVTRNVNDIIPREDELMLKDECILVNYMDEVEAVDPDGSCCFFPLSFFNFLLRTFLAYAGHWP